MGSYIGTAVHLKVRPDISPEILASLDAIFNLRDPGCPVANRSPVFGGMLKPFFHGNSSYFNLWKYSFMKPHPSGEFICVEFRCSGKEWVVEQIKHFLYPLIEFLILKDKDVVARFLTENDYIHALPMPHRTEMALYWCAKSKRFFEQAGYEHVKPEVEREFTYSTTGLVFDPTAPLDIYNTHPSYTSPNFTGKFGEEAVAKMLHEFPIKGYEALEFIPPLNLSDYVEVKRKRWTTEEEFLEKLYKKILSRNPAANLVKEGKTIPKPYSTDETRSMFIDHVWGIIDYWDNEVTRPSAREKMEGVVHSLLVTLDGGSMGCPGFRVIPISGTDELPYYVENNERFHVGLEDVLGPKRLAKANELDIGGALHEYYYMAERRKINE